MDHILRSHADAIVAASIRAVQPDEAVSRALAGQNFPGRVVLVAAGKAAWQMAKAAHDVMGNRIDSGVVVTKYDHVMGPIGNFICCEAGHPVPDENSFAGTQKALDLVADLSEQDTVLFLLSGGGSALFEKPLVPGPVLQDITGQLLACGADIVEINTIRKRLSAVKGGRFAEVCAPAKVFSIVLSDILGDPLDMIASGPAVPDTSTCDQAVAIAEKYGLKLTAEAEALLRQETPKALDNVTTQINGSVRELARRRVRTRDDAVPGGRGVLHGGGAGHCVLRRDPPDHRHPSAEDPLLHYPHLLRHCRDGHRLPPGRPDRHFHRRCLLLPGPGDFRHCGEVPPLVQLKNGAASLTWRRRFLLWGRRRECSGMSRDG